MAADYVTLDLDIFLDEEKLHALELAANQAVQRNLPTRVQVVDGADLAGMTLRKKAAGLTGPVRIVYVAGVDSCTCCGTHVAYAGETGYIHLDSAAKYKGGTRLWFSCGMRGVERAWQEKTELDKLARRFSTKSEDVVEAVARQGDELSSCKRELKQRTGELLTYRAGELLAKGEAIGGVRLAAALLGFLLYMHALSPVMLPVLESLYQLTGKCLGFWGNNLKKIQDLLKRLFPKVKECIKIKK